MHLPEDWPPRSPDLMPCDYFFLDFLKHKVYQTPPQDISDLRERIRHEANLLRESPELVRREVLEMRRLCELRNGGHVEKIVTLIE